jgi:caffeoyl-CoA O-methyltransferase
MSDLTIINPAIDQYCQQMSFAPDPVCDELEKYTAEFVPGSQMISGKLVASVLGFFIRAKNVQRILEIGTFTGYSALAMATHLPSGGELITIDISEETVNVGKKFWEKLPVHGKKIKSIIGPALLEMKKLEGTFDFIFIDADKANYLNYLKASLPMLSKNGMIVVDNCLWSGDVLTENPKDKSTKSIQELNNFVSASQELYGTLVPVRDGLFLIQKVN